ncbi:pyridoxal-phosphate-dependent aminotransferase family protein [Truepera radiovictrix]|nr:aminotransferase class V-fold PLP-dependent enzyme [Truepera radiovictrix]WMT56974.1 aminotransferase class V-fold PLP-dependent enzyme [Truepera radiovictrix]
MLHPRAAAALSWPMVGHMDPEMFAFNDRVARDLRTLYGAADEDFTALLSGTGSLGMESGLANLLEPGDRALVLSNGVFGERMGEMAARLGAEVSVLRAPLGEPIDPEAVRRAARAQPPKLIAVVHGETSTGVLNPVPEIAAVAREVGALLSVDAVTTVGMLPFKFAEWGVDYAYTGSQKCLSAPPGLAPVAYSARALQVVAARRTPVSTWYSDVSGMQGYWCADGGARRYHHTVPVQLHWATGEAIRAALEEGIAARAARAKALEDAVLAALGTVGFRAFVPARWRLPTVLAVTLPEALDDARLRAALRERFRIAVTGGLGETAGRIWRLGLMGENARPEYYARLMHALEVLLGARGLVARFEALLSVAG